MGRGWQVSAFRVCVLFIDLCPVKQIRFVFRILNVHHLNCDVLLLR
jgi:hypothetical protein